MGKKLGYYKKWHIRTFLDAVSTTVQEFGVNIPDELKRTVGAGAGALFQRLYEVAIRDNSEGPRIFCPKCKQYHHVEISAPCPVHPDEPEIPVKVDNVNAEKNSLTAAMKIFDKFLPTLASVHNTINVQGTITTVSAHLTQIVFKYVPPPDRRKCFEEIDGLLRNIQEADQD